MQNLSDKELFRQQGLIGGQWVAIDGSKFLAVASKRAVVTAAKLEQQLKAIDRQVQGYLESLDAADAAEGERDDAEKVGTFLDGFGALGDHECRQRLGE